MLETPILLIIFNRPETTKQVFEAIRKQQPKYLYVAADGPRPDRPDDVEKCEAVRNIIKVDWECELHTLFRTENRGCGFGPAEAITWFFENVEQGIILEDDVVPHSSFFDYCQQLLNLYKDDERVAMISGINLISPWKFDEASYIFSYMGGIPGWATWKRAWTKFDYFIKEWKTKDSKQRIKRLLSNNIAYKHFAKHFDYFSSINRNDVWDFQWAFTRWNIQGCAIVPGINLIENIGFGPDATHTSNNNHPQARLKADAMKFPLRHRSFHIDREYDSLIFDEFVREPEPCIINKLKKSLKRFLTRPALKNSGI